MFCSKCGEKIDENSKFCDKCGAKVGGNGINLDKVGDKVKGLADKIPTDKLPLDKIPKEKRSYVVIGAISAVIVLVVVLIVALSGGKKLKCTMEYDENSKMTIQLTFKGDKIKNMKILAEQDISDLDEDDVEDEIDSFEEAIDEVKDKGLKVKYKKTSKKLRMEVSGNPEKVAKAMGYSSNSINMSYDLVKAQYKKLGMTCK